MPIFTWLVQQLGGDESIPYFSEALGMLFGPLEDFAWFGQFLERESPVSQLLDELTIIVYKAEETLKFLLGSRLLSIS